MQKFNTVAVAMVASLAIAAAARAQQPTKASSGVPALTALDYLQIQQLVYRYAWALDSGANDGFAYGDLYTPDGIFASTNQGPNGCSYQGRERLAALARGDRRGPLFVSHYVTNVVIEPSADGAVGHTYVAILNLGEGGRTSVLDYGGRYDDVYLKTADGWRFKKRTFYESKWGEPLQPPPAALLPLKALSAEKRAPAKAKTFARGPVLTAEDYIEIQQLVGRFPFALDENINNGASYANLFTSDGVFNTHRTEGREKLAQLAVEQPHGPGYIRHFITNHVIEASSDGATGKEYLVVIDIGDSGRPNSVFLMGHYDDVYAKTSEGWRFKWRTFIPARSGDPRAASGQPAPTLADCASTTGPAR
jgi:hypothetical protein